MEHKMLYRQSWFPDDVFSWLRWSPDFLLQHPMRLKFVVFSEIFGLMYGLWLNLIYSYPSQYKLNKFIIAIIVILTLPHLPRLRHKAVKITIQTKQTSFPAAMSSIYWGPWVILRPCRMCNPSSVFWFCPGVCTLSFFWISVLRSQSLRGSPNTHRRKLISTAWFGNPILSVPAHGSWAQVRV